MILRKHITSWSRGKNQPEIGMNRLSIGITSAAMAGAGPDFAAITTHTALRRGNKRSIS